MLHAPVEYIKTKKKTISQIFFVILFNLFIISVFYQFNNNYRLNIAGGGIGTETFNFNPTPSTDEGTMTRFRWCIHKSGIGFRGVARGADYTLRLFLKARDDSPEGRFLRVKIEKKKIFEGETNFSWNWLEIKIPASLIDSDRFWPLIYTKPLVIGEGKSKVIRGLRIAKAELVLDKKHGLLIPSPRHLFNSTVFLLLTLILFFVLKFKPPHVIRLGYAVSTAFAGLLLTPLKDPFVRSMSLLDINMLLVIIIALLIRISTPGIIKYLKLPFKDGDNNRIALLSSLSIAFKSGLWFVPFTASIDMVFQVHMLEKVFSGDILNMSRAGNYLFPYPPVFFQILTPLKFLSTDHLLLLKIAFTFFMAFVPVIIYLISLKLFKDRRAAQYALIFSIVMPKDFFIYMLGIVSNGFGHFMMLLSVALTILLYDRIGKLTTDFVLYVSYFITALTHFGAMISFSMLMICTVFFLFLFELSHHHKPDAVRKKGLAFNPILFRGKSLRIFTVLVLSLATAFFYYYIRLLIPTLKNIAAMVIANDGTAGSHGFFWFSGHNLLKFLQNIMIKFGIFPFIAAVAAVIIKIKDKSGNYGDMFIFGWLAAYLIQFWLAMKESLMLRFELFVLPLVAIMAGWLFARMKSQKYFVAAAVFCLIFSIYLTCIFYSDIQKIGSIIIPHKMLKWVLW